MYTKTTLPTDGTVGPFPIGINYLNGADISVTRYDADGVSNPTTLTFSFNGTPSDDQPSGTSIVLSALEAAGRVLVIEKTISLVSPVITWSQGAELSQKNLRKTSINMMEMAQTAVDLALAAKDKSDAAVLRMDTAVDQAAAGAAIATEKAATATAALDSFKERYLGEYATEPTVSPTGAALVPGMLYFDTAQAKMFVRGAISWLPVGVAQAASFVTQTFNGNGVTVDFTLANAPGYADAMLVFVGSAPKIPGVDYSIAGTTLHFITGAPANGTGNIFVFEALAVNAGTPNDGSVSTAKIQDGAVTANKYADGSISTAKYADVSITLGKLAPGAYGTSGANKLLQLDAAGKLPPLDGSNLTGITALPVGTIIMFSGNTVPAGYLEVPTAVTNISRTTYATLFAVIGTLWGAGNGSTTFGMPYCPIGWTFVQRTAAVGGSTVGEVISHMHSYTDQGSVNSYGGTATTSAKPHKGAIPSSTGYTGGAANLAAGMRVKYAVKYI